MRPADRVEAERMQEALRERLNPGWREQFALLKAQRFRKWGIRVWHKSTVQGSAVFYARDFGVWMLAGREAEALHYCRGYGVSSGGNPVIHMLSFHSPWVEAVDCLWFGFHEDND